MVCVCTRQPDASSAAVFFISFSLSLGVFCSLIDNVNAGEEDTARDHDASG